MTRQEVINTITNCNYSYIGIRHLAEDEGYSIGDYCRNSYDWDFDHDCSTYHTDEPIDLGGTCAYNTKILVGWDEPTEIAEKLEKALAPSSCYFGDIVIIAGDRMEYGNDEGEIIIADAVVIATLNNIALAA